jgi:glycosyltransferase involved in cell wall biosynthesis
MLLDLELLGHHAEYASYIARVLRARGDEIAFATWSRDPLLDDFGFQESELLFLRQRSTRPPGNSIPSRLAWNSLALRHFLKLASDEQFDILHHLYVDRNELPLLLTAGMGSRPRPRLVGSLFWPYFVHEDGEATSIARLLVHTTNRAALRHLLRAGRMSRLLVHSPNIRARLARVFGRELAERRIDVVPDPLSGTGDLTRADARLRLGLPAKSVILLFFGGLRWDKGPDLLLEALADLKGDWLAVFAGQPYHFGAREVERTRWRLEEPERIVSRLGYVPTAEVDAYFAAADVIILPYRRAFKGTSGILQRAAGAGKPVISTDVGEIGSAVRQRGLGMVVEPESPEALRRALEEFLASDNRLTKGLRERSLSYAMEADWRIFAQGVRQTYLSSLEEDGTGSFAPHD